MALINLESRNHYGWANSSKGTLADQMLRPLFNTGPVEMCWLDYEQAILARLDNRNLYRHARETLFPDVQVLARSHVVESIVTFENTLVSGQSDFDEWLENDKRPDDAVILWFRLFASERLGCSRCHNGPDLGGHGYANTGLRGQDMRLAVHAGLEQDQRRFLVPTLRNIAATAPYMYEGRFDTLLKVIAFYATGPAPDRGLHAFHLTPEDTAAIIAFFHSLTDIRLLTNPELGPPETT